MDFENQKYFNFPFNWIWVNNIQGYRFRLNEIQATQQLHIIQDFDLGKVFYVLPYMIVITKGEAEVKYRKSMVAVLVIVTKYAQNQSKYWSICSGCSTASDLARYFNN